MLESTILPALARLGEVIWKKRGELINRCDNQEEKLSRREKEPDESNDYFPFLFATGGQQHQQFILDRNSKIATSSPA